MTILRPRIQTHFESTFNVIEGGSGVVRGVIIDVAQGAVPSNIYTAPRSILRTSIPTNLHPGLVLQSRAGTKYLVGDNGPEEYADETLFYSWRLYVINRQVSWQRRQQTTDPVSGLERDSGVIEMGPIWTTLEPIDRATMDRKTHVEFESYHFVTGRPVAMGDILDGKTVSRSDLQLGVYVGTTI